MGTDCKLKIDDKYTSLDRWYVFKSCIESSAVMTKEVALVKIKELGSKKQLEADTLVWDERQVEFMHRHVSWIYKAICAIQKAAKEARIVFYADYDTPDEYYDYFLGMKSEEDNDR